MSERINQSGERILDLEDRYIVFNKNGEFFIEVLKGNRPLTQREHKHEFKIIPKPFQKPIQKCYCGKTYLTL